MSEFDRIIKEIAESEKAAADRAYERLRRAVTDGTAIDLSDHQLVMAILKALWRRELATVQLGLSELEIRTAADAEAMAERRAA